MTKNILGLLTTLFYWILLSTAQADDSIQSKPLTLPQLQDSLSKSYSEFVESWMPASIKLKSRKVSIDSANGLTIIYPQNSINIKELEATFKAYCSFHNGVLVPQGSLFDYFYSSKNSEKGEYSCETIEPNVAIAYFGWNLYGGYSPLPVNKNYFVHLKAPPIVFSKYDWYRFYETLHNYTWKSGDLVTNGIYEGTIIKIMDNQQVLVKTTSGLTPFFFEWKLNLSLVNKLTRAKGIPNAEELANNTLSDFIEFARRWLPKDKNLSKGALYESKSSHVSRSYKGYYSFQEIMTVFANFCTKQSGKVETSIDVSRNYNLFCVAPNGEKILGFVEVFFGYNAYRDETLIAFYLNDDVIKKYKITTIRKNTVVDNIYSVGDVVSVHWGINEQSTKAKILDKNQYGFFIQGAVGISRRSGWVTKEQIQSIEGK